jgi:hypothetical protein
VPYLNKAVIRAWMVEHNWTLRRLAEECSAVGEDTFPVGTLSNAVRGLDPMRPGRVQVICKVTARYGDGIPYWRLVADKPRSDATD